MDPRICPDVNNRKLACHNHKGQSSKFQKHISLEDTTIHIGQEVALYSSAFVSATYRSLLPGRQSKDMAPSSTMVPVVWDCADIFGTLHYLSHFLRGLNFGVSN